MSTLCPYRIINGDDGLSVKVEWDVHYLTDEQIGIVRKYVAEIEAENEKLRELVEEIDDENSRLRDLVRKVEHYERLGCHECPYADGCEAHTLYDEECPMSREIERMKRELGFEVVDE